jgi:catechol 2,3-dioxygenase-like lactoylglutathione lyase family enzyme
VDFVSIRIVTHDVDRLTGFWEAVTGLVADRPVPVFAELATPTAAVAIADPVTLAPMGDAAPVPGRTGSVFVELRVEDVDATYRRVRPLVPDVVPEVVLEPTDLPWGNRALVLRDPDGGLVNLFTPVSAAMRAKYGLS